MYKTPKKMKKIDIMGTSIPILIDDALLATHGAMGLHLNGAIVMLSEYKSVAEYVDTLFHECFHALNYVLGTQLDPNLEEVLANTLGQTSVKVINALLKQHVFTPVEPK